MGFDDTLWTKLATECEVSEDLQTSEMTSEALLWAKLAADCKVSEEDCKCAEQECKCGCNKEAAWNGIFDDKHSKIDAFLGGHKIGGTQLTSVQGIVIGQRARLDWPPISGTRVMFSSKLEALLAYKRAPDPDATGSIICVRTATGDTTHQDGQVFVKWDTGGLTPIHRDHLSPMVAEGKQASTPHRMVTGSVDDLKAFFSPVGDLLTDYMDATKMASGGVDLVHKATQDLWSLGTSDGKFVLERLFNGEGEPLKL